MPTLRAANQKWDEAANDLLGSHERNRSRRNMPIRYVLMAAFMIAAALLVAPAAWAQDPSDIAAGMSLFLEKGNCQACHGWAGDGRKMDSQMPDGANLRAIPADRQVLIQTIKCGRPGTGMPAFDRLAYSDGRCFGLKQSDLLARGLEMPDPPATLQPNEVNLLADFLFAKVIGQGPMDRAKCAAYWGRDAEVCSELPN
jgi:mono/diheme cytochrome c family protein